MTQREYKLLKDWNPKKGDVFENETGERLEAISDTHARFGFLDDAVDGDDIKYFTHQYTLVSRATPDEPPVGEWQGWNGGECPVHVDTLVDAISESSASSFKVRAGHVNWQSFRGAYRVVTPYVENWTPAEEGKVYDRVKVKLVDGVVYVLEVSQ